MPQVAFHHPQIGTLVTENGIDEAGWAYGLNTATFPTYGGEVVQILSVYIDNVTLQGTISTYAQMEAIYKYFSTYLQIATQGKTKTSAGKADLSTTGPAYNMQPIQFTYPERGWSFDIFPINVPGFHLGTDVIAPAWELVAFVRDDSGDLGLIKDGIAALAVSGTVQDNSKLNTFTITGDISPQSGNPNTDPFQTYDSATADTTKLINKYASYYNSLIPAYSAGDFSALTGEFGSQPAFGLRHNTNPSGQNTVPVPKPPSTTHPSSGRPSTRPVAPGLQQTLSSLF